MKQERFLPLMRKVAVKHHGNQKYGDEFPYVIHLQAVESVLLRFGVFDELIRCVAWGHDLLEDTDLTYEELDMLFPKEVVNAIAAVTEPKGGNRKWRHEQTYPRIVQNEFSLLVKLADRIANLEFGGKKVQMYVKEHSNFKNALYGAYMIEGPYVGVMMDMWQHLDDLIVDLMPHGKITTEEIMQGL
jgi:(p)ppGpp synthase/HD superfamily hydrolase